MSDLKVDGIIASTGTNTALTLQGKGSGKVDIGDGALSFPDADGSDGEFIKTDGSGALSFAAAGGFTLATEQATTSGTSVTFGSIPAGVKMIVIMFEEVSWTGAADIVITIGDSGGLETSSYVSTWKLDSNGTTTRGSSTSSYVSRQDGAAALVSGLYTLSLKDASNFTWIFSGHHKNVTNSVAEGHGSKSLSAELTQLSIAGGTFDAGSINIMYQ
jgi:hypothetical protein